MSEDTAGPARPARAWLLAAVAMVALPHLPRLPWWLAGCAVASAGAALAMLRQPARRPPRLLPPLLAVALGGAVLFHYGTLLGKEPGVALLVVMLLLKTLELRTSRDAVLVVFLGYFLVITNFLFSQSLAMAAYMCVATLGLTAALAACTPAAAPGPPGRYLRQAGRLLGQALPFTLVVFLFFPRIEGPLWGMPEDAWTGMSGLDDRMRPGAISHLVRSEAPAFRARFHGPVPGAEQRYWRGPVLWHTDGRTWTAGSPRLLSAPPATGRGTGGEVFAYSITLEPHNRHWLLALDLPLQLSVPAIRTRDFQMLARRAVRSRIHYRGTSRIGLDTGALAADLRAAALQLPRDTSSRIRGLARSWREGAVSDQDVVQRALAHFSTQPFVYTLEPPVAGADPVDGFLFETRRGFCEHYAAAFVVLMRSAGIPARVVTGYLGGEYNPLGGYWLVRQSDAHAWAEVWLPEGGWQRVDPTAAVAPERIERPAAGTAAASGATTQALSRGDLLGRGLRQLRYLFDALNNQWHEWVLSYGPQRQLELLAALGIEGAARRHLALLLLLLAGTLLAGTALWLLTGRAAPRDPVQRAWERFCRRLGSLGLPRRAQEGPRDYARRVATQRPALAGAVVAVTELYIRLRYARRAADHRRAVARLQRLVWRFTLRPRGAVRTGSRGRPDQASNPGPVRPGGKLSLD